MIVWEWIHIRAPSEHRSDSMIITLGYPMHSIPPLLPIHWVLTHNPATHFSRRELLYIIRIITISNAHSNHRPTATLSQSPHPFFIFYSQTQSLCGGLLDQISLHSLTLIISLWLQTLQSLLSHSVHIESLLSFYSIHIYSLWLADIAIRHWHSMIRKSACFMFINLQKLLHSLKLHIEKPIALELDAMIELEAKSKCKH